MCSISVLEILKETWYLKTVTILTRHSYNSLKSVKFIVTAFKLKNLSYFCTYEQRLRKKPYNFRRQNTYTASRLSKRWN